METIWSCNKPLTRPTCGVTLLTVKTMFPSTLMAIVTQLQLSKVYSILRSICFAIIKRGTVILLIIIICVQMLVASVSGGCRCLQPRPTHKKHTLSLPLLRNMVALKSLIYCLEMSGSAVDKVTCNSLWHR